MSKVCYWDSATNSQKERDATPEEEAEIIARKAPKDPAIIKAEVWEDIKVFRDNLIQNGGYRVGVNWFHSDTFSRTQQLALVIIGANMPAGILWKTMENGWVPMTPILASQIFSAAVMQDKAHFDKAKEHKDLMELSADPSAYDYKTGWAETYAP